MASILPFPHFVPFYPSRAIMRERVLKTGIESAEKTSFLTLFNFSPMSIYLVALFTTLARVNGIVMALNGILPERSFKQYSFTMLSWFINAAKYVAKQLFLINYRFVVDIRGLWFSLEVNRCDIHTHTQTRRQTYVNAMGLARRATLDQGL